MPDSAGKRQRREKKARKAAPVEARRLARAKRREDRAAGLIEAGAPIASNEDELTALPEPDEAAPEERDPSSL